MWTLNKIFINEYALLFLIIFWSIMDDGNTPQIETIRREIDFLLNELRKTEEEQCETLRTIKIAYLIRLLKKAQEKIHVMERQRSHDR